MPIPLAGLAFGLGAPALSYLHGKSKGKNDPSKGGLFGTLATGALLNPLSGIAYGMGHRSGRDAAVDQAMDDILGKKVKLRTQDVKRDERGKALLDLLDRGGSGQMMNDPAYQLMGGPFNPLAAQMYQY